MMFIGWAEKQSATAQVIAVFLRRPLAVRRSLPGNETFMPNRNGPDDFFFCVFVDATKDNRVIEDRAYQRDAYALFAKALFEFNWKGDSSDHLPQPLADTGMRVTRQMCDSGGWIAFLNQQNREVCYVVALCEQVEGNREAVKLLSRYADVKAYPTRPLVVVVQLDASSHVRKIIRESYLATAAVLLELKH
jgi:hypothetical protein